MDLSPKQKAFLTYKAPVECAEGQTYGGKTTIGAIKFILRVKASKKPLHFIAGQDLGVVEKNIVNSENGILAMFGNQVEYFGNGNVEFNLPHIRVSSLRGNKYVFIFGYNDATRWKKALGGQYGCGMIDECNTANMDFVREAAMRVDYLLMTLNPDDPNLEIYSEYINHCRPLPEWERDVPKEMMIQLQSRPAKKGWVHWFFRMDDNPSLTPEKKAKILANVPEGTKIWKSKILGLRGRAEGIVFKRFDRDKQVINLDMQTANLQMVLKPMEQVAYIFCGLDTGIERDATALVTILVTTSGRLIILPSMYYDCSKNNDLSNAPSSQALTIQKWLDYWLNKFGLFDPSSVKICCDSAAVTNATAKEINIRTHYNCVPVEKKDRINDTLRAIGIIEKEGFVTIVNCGNIDPTTFRKVGDTDMFVVELENQVWDKKKGNVPEDGNDHCIDAFKYGTYQIYNGGIY